LTDPPATSSNWSNKGSSGWSRDKFGQPELLPDPRDEEDLVLVQDRAEKYAAAFTAAVEELAPRVHDRFEGFSR
jgi:hypothetical protein